ncbi:MAG: M23 family metallopeptidase [Bradymonadales bacterium]|nr:MAG: M23 family metallopeptidase [Bradymonadales bacterium]
MSRNSKGRERWKQGFRQRFGWLRHWLKRDPEPLTLLLMTKGHLEVRKLYLSPKSIWWIKIGSVAAVCFLALSTVIFIQFVVTLPDRSLLERENLALQRELNHIQFHLDTLQTTVDRVQRFNHKLRALTDVDKEFAKRQQGPLGQGGGEEVVEDGEFLYHFGDFSIEENSLELARDSQPHLDRRQRFLVQKLYSWMNRLYRDTELESQSVEELFEVLKGQKLQLAATPSIMPVRGWVTSHFGYRIDPFSGRRSLHRGMDVAARKGSPIVSPAEGVVSFSGPYGGFGNTVIVFHGYGISTLYAHAQDLLVRAGQRVSRGDVLATVGNTGRSTGAHLHYEVRVNGIQVDPRKYILDRSL